MTNTLHCHSCEAKLEAPYLEKCKDYYMGNPGEFNYYICDNCSLIQLSPIPENIGSFYKDYQVHQEKGKLHEKFRNSLMQHAYFPTSKLAGIQLLDYGCGDGWFLKHAKDSGANVKGFEINAEYAKTLQTRLKLPVVSELDTLEKGSFDLITLNFVLEHLINPKESIIQLAKLLKPGGLLYCTIPNLQSGEAKIFGRYWHGIDAPRHISFYAPKSISDLIKNSGLTLKNLRTFGVPTGFAGSMCHILTKSFNYPLFAILTVPGVLFVQVVNDGNYAITAQKPAN